MSVNKRYQRSGITTLVILLFALFVATPVLAVPASFDWASFDATGSTSFGVYDTDNTTVLETGDLAQLIWAGPDGVVDAPLGDGSPGGDDQILQSSIIQNNAGPPTLQNKGYIFLTTYSFDTEDTQANGTVYIRAWNAADPGSSTAYGDSITGTLTSGGSLNAPRWFTDTPFGTVNDAPVANDDSVSTDEDTPLSINALANDTDANGDTLTIDSATQGANGSVSTDGATIIYTPDANFNGNDSFTYTISDGNGGSDTATVSLTVNPVNDNPGANDDSASTDEDTAVVINVLANDTDVDGDTLTIDTVTQGANGSVSTDGSTVTYTPDADFNGGDSFTYTISDGNGGSDTATVAVTVDPVNDNPVANDDSANTDEDTAVSIDVLANDTDLDGDALTIDSVTQGTNGSVSTDGATVIYTPTVGFSGNDGFSYTISDGNGGSDTAAVSVTVSDVNFSPDAVDDSASTDEDTAVVIDVLANDTDADGDSLTIDSVTQGSDGSVSTDGATITYTPNANFNGSDSFAYTISDGNGGSDTAMVSVTVDPVNDDPVANDDAASTDENMAVTVDVLANDTDVDGDALTIDSVTQGASGFVSTDGATVTYTPDTGFNGNDSFIYTISDGNGGTDTATVSVTVDPVNDDPVANDDSASTDEDTAAVIDVLANDTDADGDSLTIDSTTQGANGSVSTDGVTVTYTPNADFNGSDSFTYTISDGNGGSDTATVSVTVDPINDGPVANGDVASTNEDTVVVIDVLANDTDVDGDSLTIDSVTQGTNGSVSTDGSTVTYTPDADFNGSDSFTYTLSDGNGGSDTATVSVTVDPVNDDPVANDDTASTDEDTAVTVDVLDNDIDVDGDTLTIDSVTQGTNGSVSTDGATATYTPDADFNGSDSFTYTISDGNGGSDTATVTVTVDPVNDAPLANSDSASTDEDTAVIIDVLANDTDVDGDTLSVISIIQANNGSVVNNGTSVTYTPDANFNGLDSFLYTISDGNGGTDTSTVNVTVDPVNDDPVANDDSASTDEDTAVVVDVLTNDTDVDGDSLTIVSTTQGTNGSVSTDGATVTYTPDADFNGSDSFTYTISDGNGGSDTVTVSITVDPVNDDPVANDDAASTDEDTAVTVVVLDNDTDVDGDVLTIGSVTQGTNGAVSTDSATVTYTPNADFNGSDSFTYTISDGNGSSDTATVTVTVDPINDAPVAVDDTATVNQAGSVTINVLTNDSDIDGDTLTVDSFTQGANGSVSSNGVTITYTHNGSATLSDSFTYTVSDGNGGTDTATVSLTVSNVNDIPDAVDDSASTDEDTPVTVDVLANDTDADGDSLTIDSVTQGANGSVSTDGATVTYTPAADFNGSDSFTYTISDGNGGSDTATVSVTVDPVNDAPVANDDSDSTSEDTAVTIDVLANDTDVDGDSLTIDSITQGSNGSVSTDGATVTYTPDADFNGSDSFTYTISDGNGGSDTATVSVTVDPVNDDPVANDDSDSTSEDTAVTIDVLANDTDADGDTLTIDSITQGANGSVSTDGATVTYTPDTGFSGSDSFTYTISDGNGGSDTATVTVTVSDVNVPPDAADDNASTDEDTAVTIDVLANDTDADGDSLTIDSVTQGANGAVSTNGTTVTYTPDADFNGNDSFTYTISDGNGGSGMATVSVTVDPVNDAPVANDDAASTDEDTAVIVDVLANDTDVDGDTLSVDSVTQSTNGSVSTDGAAVTYTPDADFNGSDSFTYTISDGNGGSDTATVSVTVNPVNDAPLANSDSASTDEDTAVTIDVLANDTDVDGDTLSVTSVIQPNNGSVVNNGTSVTYTPDADFNGNDSFLYTISDGNGGTDTSTVTITVTSVNDDPVANDDFASTDEDTVVTVDVLANDADVDGDTLTVDSVTQGANGSVSTDGATVTYTPDTGFSGSDTFTYTVSDGNGGSDTATVTVTVSDVNFSPDAVDDSASTDEDTAVTIDVLSNDTDADGDTLTIDSVTQGADGTVSTDGSTVTYTPDANFNGSDSFTYTISDGNGGSDTATVTITVDPVNDDPVANDDATSTDEDTAVTVDVLANDTDVDGDALMIDSVTQGSNGAVSTDGATVTYTPDAGFTGSDSFTYTVSDGNGGSDTATVAVTVNSAGGGIEAIIDITPRRTVNLIRIDSPQRIQVLLFGSSDLNVADINLFSLQFGPAGAEPISLSFADINRDGRLDLLATFVASDTGIALGDVEACLSGATFSGTTFEGCDSIVAIEGGRNR